MGGLINLAKTTVSVPHKGSPKIQTIKVEKAQGQEIGGHAAGDQKQIQSSS